MEGSVLGEGGLVLLAALLLVGRALRHHPLVLVLVHYALYYCYPK